MGEQHTEEDLLKLLDELVTISDEFEGQQMVDLSNVDACSTDVDAGNNYSPTDFSEKDLNELLSDANGFMNDVSNGGLDRIFDSSYKAGNFAIIEFADGNGKYQAEEYSLYVKPGDNITSETTIGSCIQGGKWKPIKSVFSSGEVLAKEDDPSSFKRLFPDCKCDRHIIIKDFKPGTDSNYDVSALEEIAGEFSAREEYFQIFKDVLNYSVLPLIISKNRNLTNYVNIIADDRTDLQIFDIWQEHIDKTVENFVNDERLQIKEDKIRKTGGNGEKVKKLGEESIELQEKFLDGEHSWGSNLNGMIDLYRNYAPNTREWYKKEDTTATTLEGLMERVFDTSINEDGTGQNNYHDCKNLGVTYYLDLLGRVPSDYDSDLTNELYDLISDIITNRNKFEQHSIEEIVYWLNKTEQDEKILPNKFTDDIVTLLDRQFEGSVSFTDVYSWLVENKRKKASYEACARIANVYIYFRKNKKDVEYDYSAIYKNGKKKYDAINNYYSGNSSKRYRSDYSKSSEGVSNKNLQAEIEVDIQNNGTKYYDFLPETLEKNIDYYKLTMLEKYRLDQFWDKAISDYKNGLSITSLTNKLKTAVSNDYAEWPSPLAITIDNQTYTYYFFDNIDAWKEENRIQDTPDVGDIPADLTKVTLPEDPSTLGKINPEGNDDDIPLLDYGKTYADLTEYKYWLKYFGIATVCSLPYFAPSGIRIAGKSLPLPAVFIPIYPMFLKALDILLITGLSIRGLSIQPIFLFVNTSNSDLTALTPLVLRFKEVKQEYDDWVYKLENAPRQYAQKCINKVVEDTAKLIRENVQINVQIDAIKSISFPGMEKAKREIESKVEHINPRQHNYRKEDLMQLEN